MSHYDYDLFVIGAGSGGIRAARTAAELGARVAIAENRYLGGTCINVGCVPKKLFVYASQFSEAFASAAGFGWTVDKPIFGWTQLITNKNKEIKRLQTVYQGLLENSGVKLLDGKALILNAHSVQVGDQSYSAERILIATGGRPMIPDMSGKQYGITSNDIFSR